MDVMITVVDCNSCKAHYELLGKNGTSMPYIRHCPSCGSGNVEVNAENLEEREER